MAARKNEVIVIIVLGSLAAREFGQEQSPSLGMLEQTKIRNVKKGPRYINSPLSDHRSRASPRWLVDRHSRWRCVIKAGYVSGQESLFRSGPEVSDIAQGYLDNCKV